MSSHKVTFIDPEGNKQTIKVPEGANILDEAENQGLELPCSCQAGGCSTCAGKLISGTVTQDEQQFLSAEQLEQNYVLICVAYATSDCVIETHKEEELY